MGSLLKDTPFSEIAATVELLGSLGINRQDLKTLRTDDFRAHAKEKILELVKVGDRNDPIVCGVDPLTLEDWYPDHLHGGGFPWYWEAIAIGHQLFRPLFKERDRFYDPEPRSMEEMLSAIRAVLYCGHPVGQVFDGNVADRLFLYPDLIPEEWKGKTILFAGSQYRPFHTHSCEPHCRAFYWDGSAREWKQKFIPYTETYDEVNYYVPYFKRQ